MRSAPFSIASQASSDSLMRNFWLCVDEVAPASLRSAPWPASAMTFRSDANTDPHRLRLNSHRQRHQNAKELNKLSELNTEVIEFLERQAHEALPSPCAGN